MSQQPSWRDVEQATRLISDIACAAPSGGARETILLERACALLGAHRGFLFRAELLPRDQIRLVTCHDHGLGERERELIRAYLSENGQDDPLIGPSVELVRQASLGSALGSLREELLPDAEFYRAPHFEFCREMDVDSRLILSLRLGRNQIMNLSLHRPLGDRGFGERERRLATILWEQSVRVLPWVAAPFGGLRRGLDGSLLDLVDCPAGFEPLAEALGFTAREREVARWVVRGLSNKEIAVELSISPQTVKRHVSNVLCKAQAETRTELAYRLSDPPADGRASG